MSGRTLATWIIGVVALVLVLASGAVYVLTSTDWGHERVRLFAIDGAAKIFHGRIRIDGLHGDLLRGTTLTGVAITDSAGAPFFAADSVSVRYLLAPFFNKRIALNNVRIVRPVIVIDRIVNRPSLGIPSEGVHVFYRPLEWFCERVPPAGRVLDSYMHLWFPH